MTLPKLFTFGTASQALPRLCAAVLDGGDLRDSRVGATRELNNVTVSLLDPFPFEITTPGRKVSLPAQIAETMWILAGRNDIEWLSEYLPRAKDFSDDGKTWRGGYGPRLRGWYVGEVPQVSSAYQVDQLRHVVDLLKEDPETRRAVFNIYNPAIDTEPGKDIPCNNWVHFLKDAHGALNATVAIRSNDLMWGWSGINSFEWSALNRIVAKLVGLRPGRVTFNISSLHLYDRHLDKAAYLGAQNVSDLPSFPADNPDFAPDLSGAHPVTWLDATVDAWFYVEGLIREDPFSSAAIEEINNFPEPMFRSWLQVLQAWHAGDDVALELVGTSLEAAFQSSPKKRKPEPVATPAPAEDNAQQNFLKFVQGLHAEKDAAYGDSWCRRGEQMAIMANIARKVDRLGVAGAGDTAADTAIDMAVYLVKYGIWHLSHKQGRREVLPLTGPEHVQIVNERLAALPLGGGYYSDEELAELIKERFDTLESLVKANTSRGAAINNLASLSWALAFRLWTAENKKEAWKAGNASRPFNGYATTEEG